MSGVSKREQDIKALLKEEEEEEEEEISSRNAGRPERIDVETAAAIYQELKEEEGFSSYQEVQKFKIELAEILSSIVSGIRKGSIPFMQIDKNRDNRGVDRKRNINDTIRASGTERMLKTHIQQIKLKKSYFR